MLFKLVAWFIFLALTATALLHVYWGLGGLWPASSEPELVRTVIGITHQDHMPAMGMTLIVAALIFSAGGFAALRGILELDSLIFIRIPLAGLALIFLLRGAATYFPGPLRDAAEPFATLNTLYFSPLVLLIGCGFALLTLSPRN